MATLRIDRKLRTRKRRVTILRGVSFLSARIFVGIPLLAIAADTACAQATFDFSGLWKQDNDRCQPKRNGDVTLRIEHHGPELTVETSISRHSSSPRQAVQKYTTFQPDLLDRGTRRRPYTSLERDMVAQRERRNTREDPQTPE
jgi:hypothetical protein